ncbi:MAG: flagellar biosynthesis protein [Candidatus Riflebacteria bacterium]|nr:flagellar biosynthesis protein [Candidatus Riflebacteria bacterium]
MDIRVIANMLENVSGTQRPQQHGQGLSGNTAVSGRNFASCFNEALGKPKDDFQVSAHAQKRFYERSIMMDSALRSSLSTAFRELEEKGGKDSLVLTDRGAFIVNVPNRTVVTAMNLNELQNGTITNIDSVNMRKV